MNKRVAVVGAGLAGLACAKRLQAQGVDVMLFEKSRGPSGRLSTRRTETTQYDHGAQYFTARDPVFLAQVQQWIEEKVVARWQPRLPVAEDEPWYVGTPGMSAIGRHHASGLDLKVQSRVVALERPESGVGWRLVMEDGSDAQGFQSVVVAVPNEQAVPLLRPHEPRWTEQLAATPMLPCWTVMFSTADALTQFDAISPDASADLPPQAAIGWWARNSSKPARPVVPNRHDWVVQATPEWTTQHLDTDKAEVVKALLGAFAGVLGHAQVVPLEPAAAHRWLYARRTPGLPVLGSHLWHQNLALGVCGDGLSHSRVEQAFLSGVSLAQAILVGRS